MATKTKRTTIGNYITKYNNYDIRQKVTYKKDKKKPQVASSELIVSKGRNTIKGGFKNQTEARGYIDNL